MATSFAIVIAACDDDHILAFDGVNKSMLVVNAPGPISGEIPL
jgi:hypothetical protein